jgi:hypothetical protein
VCDQETSKKRRLKPATGLWKIQPQWVVTPGKQTKRNITLLLIVWFVELKTCIAEIRLGEMIEKL